jgi:hypothetical protein
MKPFTTITAILLLLMSSSIKAQERSQADIKISALTLTQAPVKKTTTRLDNPQPVSKTPNALEDADPIQCSITVHNDNDDNAYQAMLTVTVPVEVAMINSPSNATVVKHGSSPYTGYLVFNLGNMKVGQSVTVQFSFTKSKFNNKVGAFVYSSSPDPNPSNNFKDASL